MSRIKCTHGLEIKRTHGLEIKLISLGLQSLKNKEGYLSPMHRVSFAETPFWIVQALDFILLFVVIYLFLLF